MLGRDNIKLRKGFTLIEVLIAIVLMGIILPPLYKTVILLRESNAQLFKHLEDSKEIKKMTETMFRDISGSTGKMIVKKDEYSRICMERTSNSLYDIEYPRVCWVVLKEGNILSRVEGKKFNLPSKYDDIIEVDSIIKDIEVFDIYVKKDKVLVIIKEHSSKPITFIVQGITDIDTIVKKKKKRLKNKEKILGRERGEHGEIEKDNEIRELEPQMEKPIVDEVRPL